MIKQELILSQRLKLLVSKKKKFKKVLVVLGGNSGEREISLNSGKACIKALKNKKYSVSSFDPKFKNLNLINKKKQMLFSMLCMVKRVKMVQRKVTLSI